MRPASQIIDSRVSIVTHPPSSASSPIMP
jgi:hypothetical protein